MKKFLAVIASLMLAVTLFAFAGCGDSSDTGVIKGDYKEPTDEQLDAALENVNLGSVAAVKGFELKLDADVDILGWQANPESGVWEKGEATIDGSVNMQLVEETTGLKGAADAEIKVKAASPNEPDKSVDTTFKADGYVDGMMAYGKVSGVPGLEGEMKAKVDLNEVLKLAGGIIPTAVEAAPSIPGNLTDLNGLITMLKTEYKVNVGLDTKDGTKIKLSITEDSVWAALEEFAGDKLPAEQLAVLKQSIKFNAFDCALYLHFDKDGNFVQAGINVNIDLEMPMDDSHTDKLTCVVGLSLKAYDGKVSVPSDLATDTSYTDMTEAIKNIGGNKDEYYPSYN